jgi:hypothetical protein
MNLKKSLICLIKTTENQIHHQLFVIELQLNKKHCKPVLDLMNLQKVVIKKIESVNKNKKITNVLQQQLRQVITLVSVKELQIIFNNF